MDFLSLIEAKRSGQSLTTTSLAAAVQAFTRGDIPDYQMSAFLMAVYFQGLNEEETGALLEAMLDSGERLRMAKRTGAPVVDKHSTGGVGDKVSLVLAPLLAALGFRVPMISGRGLGITGGTLDKMEAIPGFQTRLPARRIEELADQVGCVICGQTEDLVPADRLLYALRDATGTVPSIPLIVASILSKKQAEDLDVLVLDVKFGTGAFMPDLAAARQLAGALVLHANRSGLRTRALLTDMNQPLGQAAGNWLEVREAVRALECQGPPDLELLVLELAAHTLVLAGRAADLATARQTAAACLASGKPREKWDAMLEAQGADLQAFTTDLRLDSRAPVVREFETPDEGFLARCDARIIGEIVRDLGGGRRRKEDAVDSAVGIDGLGQVGEPFGVACRLARVHARTEAEAERALDRLEGALGFSEEPVEASGVVAEVVGD